MMGNDPQQNKLMMDYLMRMGELQQDQAQIDQKRALVNLLRQQSAPPGMRGSGRVQVAANPLEMVGSVLGQGLAGYKGAQADTEQQEYAKRRREELAQLRKQMEAASGIAGSSTMPLDFAT